MFLHDPFRVVPWRHLGHGFAISAAFGPTIYVDTHDLLTTVGMGYIIGHAVHRATAVGGNSALQAFFNTLLFDGLASFLLPTLLTYHVHLMVRVVVRETRTRSSFMHRAMPVLFSLASLAVTWRNIDHVVGDLLNHPLGPV